MNKQAIFLAVCLLSAASSATADEGATLQSLENAIGATDAYRISCQSSADPAIGATHHLNFKILDSTPATNTGAALQYINVHVKKGAKKTGFLTHDAPEIAPGEKDEFFFEAGTGAYKFEIDTVGSNLAVATPQTFSIETRCLNADDQLTKPAKPVIKAKKIKNGKKLKLTASCSKSRLTGPTTKLFVKIVNTTIDPSKVVINAQVIKDRSAANVTDGNGDEVYSDPFDLQGGNGDYTVLVNDTAFDPQQDNTRTYEMAYRCENSAGVDTGTAVVTQVQDQ